MKRIQRSRFAVAAAVVLAAVSGASAQESVDRTLPAPADGTVAIENVAGSIRIEGSDDSQVRVTGTLGKGTERLEFENTGRRTLVKVVLPRHTRHVEATDLVVHVPRRSEIEAEGVSAAITVNGITGELDLQTVSGEVIVAADPRELRAQTVSGDISLRATCDEMAVATVSGNVSVEGSGNSLEVSTVSGDATLRVDRVGRLRCSSVSGDLEFAGAPAADASFQVESHSGNVRLELPGDVSADFEISTFSGDIDNAFGQKAKRASKYAPGRELQFSTGSGDAKLDITTFSGDVVLTTR